MCPLWLIIGKAALRDEGERYSDDPDAFAAQEERRSSWRRANTGGVVACGVQGPLVDGGGELPGAGSSGDGHACLPCALAVRAINDDPAVSSDGGLLAQRARRRDACVETPVQQARTPIMSGTHGHAFLELCYASDSELAAAVIEHSVVIRVTSFEDVQLTSTRPALHCLLMICKAYDVVVDIWVLIQCTACAPFRLVNEKLGAETGNLAMTYKLEVAAVGLCRHAVGNGGGFIWKWSNDNELWDSVVVRNLFARCGSFSCLVSTTAVGQQFVDREGACSTLRCWKCSRRSQERHTLTSSIISCALLKTMLTATDSTHRCNRMLWRSTVIHRGTLLRRHFFDLQGTQWTQNSPKGVSCTSTRGEISPRIPSRTITWQCATRSPWCHLTITSLRTCSCQGPG